jgi:ATP-dependent Zn protease
MMNYSDARGEVMRRDWSFRRIFTPLIAGLIVCTTFACSGSNQPRVISYSQLNDLIEESRVSELVITGSSVSGEARYVDPSTKRRVQYGFESQGIDQATANNLSERARAKGVKVQFKNEENRGLLILLQISPVVFLLLAVLASCFWLWMLIECAVIEPSEGNDKLVWILIILFMNLLGALLYFIFRRPKLRSPSLNPDA